MTHIAAALFFALVLVGAAAIMQMTVREYWEEILAALKGEMPARRTHRPWGARARVISRPRPVVVRVAAQPQRAAS